MHKSEEKQFMEEAIQLAKDNVNNGLGGPFGCVIVKDGQIIAKGNNLVTSSNDPTAHAEVVAIREACKKLNSFQLEGCEIYSSCEPCPMCLGAIYWARPAKLFFGSTRFDAADAGFDDSLIYQEISLTQEERQIPTKQIMRNEALEAFSEWKTKTDRIDY